MATRKVVLTAAKRLTREALAHVRAAELVSALSRSVAWNAGEWKIQFATLTID